MSSFMFTEAYSLHIKALSWLAVNTSFTSIQKSTNNKNNGFCDDICVYSMYVIYKHSKKQNISSHNIGIT